VQEGEEQVQWDITQNKWVDVKFDKKDYDRFPKERERFRTDVRLKSISFPAPQMIEEVDWLTAIKAIPSIVSMGDFYTEPFDDLLMQRLTDTEALLERFDIPAIEDRAILQPLHSKAVPKEGAYRQLRMQVYWLALHVWLLHSKQHIVQESEGVFGSALCSSITRRAFEWQWSRVRLWLHAVDVPIMAITGELQDLQEFVFGLCVALDDAFKEETLDAKSIEDALAFTDSDCALREVHGLAPRVKYALWANVYSGKIDHDASHLYELTVYLLRQRMALEALPRGSFLTGRFQWADFPETPTSEASS